MEPALPVWVRKRDGTTESFDPEEIHRALYAATETAGHADAFLARELTDGVLHFLAADADPTFVTTAFISDTQTKVVRELGYAWVAKALAETAAPDSTDGPRIRHDRPDAAYGPTGESIRSWLAEGKSPIGLARRVAAVGLESFTLDNVYPPNLKAAHEEGLLVLGGLSAPRELAAAAIRFPLPESGGARSGAAFEVIEQARQYVGGVVAFDAPEHELAHRGLRVGELPGFLREMEFAARTLALGVEINLGSETPPGWAEELSSGPLFEDAGPESQERIGGHFGALAEHLSGLPARAALRLNWHLAERDFGTERDKARLLRLVRSALAGAPITFVCDRQRRPVALADGLSRDCPAIVQWVGLNLPALLERFPDCDARGFAGKLTSLVRLAASAGARKRDFVRRYGQPGRPAFLLDQARLGLYFIGLPAVAKAFFGESVVSGDPPRIFMEGLLRDMETATARESPLIPLRCVWEEMPHHGGSFLPDSEPHAFQTDWRGQLGLAGRFHAANGRGTVRLAIEQELAPEPLRVVETLHHAWKRTAVHRIRLERVKARQTQLTAAWNETSLQ